MKFMNYVKSAVFAAALFVPGVIVTNNASAQTIDPSMRCVKIWVNESSIGNEGAKTGTVPFTTKFRVQTSSVNTSPKTFIANFGDGTRRTYSSAKFSHTYTHPDQYLMGVTVKNADGSLQDSCSTYITAKSANPEQYDSKLECIRIHVTKLSNEKYKFRVQTSSVNVYTKTYDFNFGDNTRPVKNVKDDTITHVFGRSGTFTVVATAKSAHNRDDVSLSDTCTQKVTVSIPTNNPTPNPSPTPSPNPNPNPSPTPNPSPEQPTDPGDQDENPTEDVDNDNDATTDTPQDDNVRPSKAGDELPNTGMGALGIFSSVSIAGAAVDAVRRRFF